MGKVTNRGFSKSIKDAPQPTSIIMGRNLRKNMPAAPIDPKFDDTVQLGMSASEARARIARLVRPTTIEKESNDADPEN